MLKKIFTDREILSALSLIGRLGLNVVISLLIFFFLSLYLDKKFNAGNIILIAGILIGIFSGVYLNFKHLKKFYEQDKNRH